MRIYYTVHVVIGAADPTDLKIVSGRRHEIHGRISERWISLPVYQKYYRDQL